MIFEKKHSLITSILMVIASSTGIGCFYIPAAYKNNGIIIGLVISLLVGTFSVLSLKVLAKATISTGAESYGSLLYYAYSDEINASLKNQESEKPFISIPRLFDFFVFIDCLFCIPIFLIVLSDLIPPMLSYFGYINDHFFMFNSKTAIISLCSLIFFPICIPLNCFNWFGITFLSLFSILFCFFSLFSHIFNSGFNFNDITTQLTENLSFSNSIYGYQSLFNICIFAFFSQFNIITSSSKLRNPSNSRLRILTASSGIILVFSYSIMAILSFMFYGNKTEEFILNNLPYTSLSFFIGRLLLATSIFFLLPLHIYPMLEALTNCIDNNYLNEINESRKCQSDQIEQGTFLLKSDSQNIKIYSKNSFSKSKSGRILLLSFILILSCIIAIKFQNNQASLVILAGGFVDSIFVFLFPALIHKRILYNGEKFAASPIRILFSILFLMSLSGSINCIFNLLNLF